MADPYITPSPMQAVLRVNGLVQCDCGHTAFKIGLAVMASNNFIRLLECCLCGKQMPATHRSDAQLAPTIGGA